MSTPNYNSILTTVKKMVGIADDYTAFDADIIVATNTALMALYQLGVAKTDSPLQITGTTELWSDLIGTGTTAQTDIAAIKTYIGLKVKMMFDPTTSAQLAEAYKEAIRESEYRLLTQVEVFRELE